MDQVIGNLDPVQRPRQSLAREGVASDDLRLRGVDARALACQRFTHPCRVTTERADGVPVGEQPGHQKRADEATGATDEDPHSTDDDAGRLQGA